MSDKVTIMVLKVVDLHCDSCYKKIKKVLCKFPEIRNQVYDEKANTVTITVVCCNPEKIRDKLCYKGGKTIARIDIKRPPAPTPTPLPNPPASVPTPTPPVPNPPASAPTPPPAPVPVEVCCGQCYGHYGGPCYHWYGRPVPCCDGYGYRYGYCYKKICYVSPCDCVNIENTSLCTFM